MFLYYDPGRDRLVNGIYFSAELLAFLRDVMDRESNDQHLELSPEGLAGLSGLLTMIQQCIHDISRQLHEGNAWRTAAALYGYLRIHPEAEESLYQLLEQAIEQGFTSWGDVSLD